MRKALTQLNMDGLVVEDHLYVDARDTPPDATFWDYGEQSPQTWVDNDVMRAYMRTPSETVRHFRAVRGNRQTSARRATAGESAKEHSSRRHRRQTALRAV
jgi:hypothetical protein